MSVVANGCEVIAQIMKDKTSYISLIIVTFCFILTLSTGKPAGIGQTIAKGEIVKSIQVMREEIDELRERVTQLEIKGAAKKDLDIAFPDKIKNNNHYRRKRGRQNSFLSK